MNADSHEIILGDPAAEVAAIQLLAIIHSNAATWIQENTAEPIAHTVPMIFLRSAHYLSLLSLGAPETPLEIIALSARSVFELFLRLKYILMGEGNGRQWRSEAAKDQVEIYEAILTLDGNEAHKQQIRAEIGRVEQHSANRDLDSSVKIMMAREVAKKAGLHAEYLAFYKLYSKLVHPSSFTVNWPKAASTPMYRSALIANIQVYANLMLKELLPHALPLSDLRDRARSLFREQIGTH